MDNGLLFLIITLATWRVTHLLQAEDGPWDIIFRIRKAIGNGFWGSLMDCFYCLSIWIALPFGLYFGKSWIEKIILWLAVSAGAILIERITTKEKNHPNQ